MESKIECTCAYDERFAKEFFSFHDRHSSFGIAYTVCILAAILLGGITAIAEASIVGGITVLLGIWLFILRALRIRKNARLFLKRENETNHGSPTSRQLFVGEDTILFICPETEMRVEHPISTITRAYLSKNYVYLRTKARCVLSFDIREFHKGTPDELFALMRKKGVRVRQK